MAVSLLVFLNGGDSKHNFSGPFNHLGLFLRILLALMIQFTRLIDLVVSLFALSTNGLFPADFSQPWQARQ